MNVSLTPHLESLIRQKVETGRYNNASEVVREALRLLEERDQFNRTKAAIDHGLAQVERGEVTTWTADSMQRIQAEADEEDRLGLPISADGSSSPSAENSQVRRIP